VETWHSTGIINEVSYILQGSLYGESDKKKRPFPSEDNTEKHWHNKSSKQDANPGSNCQDTPSDHRDLHT